MGTSKGTADVEYANHEEALEAIHKLDNGKIEDQVVQVKFAPSPSPRRGRVGAPRRVGAVRKLRGGSLRRKTGQRGRGRTAVSRGRGGRGRRTNSAPGRVRRFRGTLGRTRRSK